jgi:predicted nucleic acid-binding protein
MPCYYFDSSALVKRYVNEIGSAWVQNITAPRANIEIPQCFF